MSVLNATDDNQPPPRAPRYRKPGGVRWRDRDMIPFLISYKNHPILWDSSLPSFRNKVLREAAMMDMAQNGIPTQANLTAAAVLDKINNIRSAYKVERTQVMNGEKFGFEYQPKLYWYPLADEFLRPVTGKRRSKIEVIYKMDSSDDDDGDKSAKKNKIAENNKPDQHAQSSNPGQYTSTGPESATEPGTQPGSQEDQYPVQFIHRGTKRYNGKRIPQNAQEEDEFDFFGKAISVQLRKMPLPDALSLHQELLTLMNKALVRGLQPAVETPLTTIQPTFNDNPQRVVKSEDDSDDFGEEYDVKIKMEDDDDNFF